MLKDTGLRKIPVFYPTLWKMPEKLRFLKLSQNRMQEHETSLKGYDALLSALGSTRKQEGSAEQFRRIDLNLNFEIAVLARRAGVKHFGIVSTQGANSKIPYLSFRLFHSLLYLKTKGELEEKLKTLEFSSLSIFRPGLLNRTRGKVRQSERIAQFFLSGLPTAHLAKVMIEDAYRALESDIIGKNRIKIFEGQDFRR